MPPGALERVQEVQKGGASKLTDANGARLLTSGSITLRVKSGARVAPCEFRVANDIAVPVILGCTFMDQNSHAILPSDQTIRWIDGSCTSILRGPGDRTDRGDTVSRVLGLVHNTTLDPRSTHILWVRTEWGGLALVFGSAS